MDKGNYNSQFSILNSQFESIRPFNPEELPAAYERLLGDEQFRQVAGEELRQQVRQAYQLPEQYILYVGSIEERKNLKLVAEALAQMDDRQVSVIAVGRRTTYADAVQQTVDHYGLTQRFRMISGIPFGHLPAIYQQATVFVYPSRFEGFGIPMLEALCSGTPAIGCTGSCLEEAGGPASIYVSPDDPAELAHKLDRLLADNTLREHMRTDGYAHAKGFEMKTLTLKLCSEYARLLPNGILKQDYL